MPGVYVNKYRNIDQRSKHKPMVKVLDMGRVLNTLGIEPFPFTPSTLPHLWVCLKCFLTLSLYIQLSTHSLKPRPNDVSFTKPSWILQSVLWELPKPCKAPCISSLEVAKLCVATTSSLPCNTESLESRT